MFSRKWRLSLLLVFALIASACATAAPTAAPPAATPPSAVTQPPPATAEAAGPAAVRIGWAGSPDTLNTGAAVLSEAYTIFELVYDSMYELQLDGSYTLDLAESVAVSDDALEYTYTLRSGVTFHDGEPLTAQDVVFSYLFYQSHEDFPYLNTYTAYFDAVEAPDDQTVVVRLTEPIPNIEYQLVYLYVLPEHIWAEHAEGAAATEFENFEMIGSGPFKMVEYAQNEFVHLAAVKDHFLHPPQIDEVIFQTFENEDALVQALRTGQVDLITEMPNTAVPTLRNAENIQLVVGPPFAPEVTDIILNQVEPENCPTDDGGLCTGHPALRDRNVRLALAHATDKQQIIDIVLLGLGTPGLTLIPDSLGAWYNDTLQDYAYDIAQANQILDDAGYADVDGDGVREMPDGANPLNFRLQWPSDSTVAPRTAELLSDMWSQVGVRTQLAAMDPDALTSVCCPAFDFDVMIWGWGSDPDPNLLLGVMTTEQIPTGSSETGYSNPTYDELFVQQSKELDKEQRREIVWEMQQIVHDDVVYVIPFYAQATQAYRSDRFTGWITDQGKIALEDVSSLVVIEPVQ
ncbi:MAG TPA: ABC transporter substrate-binding protein [Anaerolineae bacterium]|nr:ABC transporter substrate-binding protein [Anaerolineae bacterium]